jgi:hypothetical protein
MTYVGGEEKCRCSCHIYVIHSGIPHGGACPPARGAHSGGGQYPAEGGDGQYPARVGGGGHVGGCPIVGDPPHRITDVGPV